MAAAIARQSGSPVFCGDPRSKVKEPLADVTYLPEGLAFAGDGGGADWIATYWMRRPGPWVLEGHVMARALRRWLEQNRSGKPCDKIIVLARPAFVPELPGQASMHKGVMKVWREIETQLALRGMRIEELNG